jgi:hypothetical protein
MTLEEAMKDAHHECADCGAATTPGEIELDGKGGFSITPAPNSWEHYMVGKRVWGKAGMAEAGGSLCIGCLERRLGRRLRPKDFSFHIPGYFWNPTPRLGARLRGEPDNLERCGQTD